MPRAYNKGEWSELYAFIKLLKEGKIYAADANACRIEDVYLPILRIIRGDQDYYTGQKIRIYKDGQEIRSVGSSELAAYVDAIFPRIFFGDRGKGAFEIPEAEKAMDALLLSDVKASSAEKVDIEMQVHDTNTGYDPKVGFSIKSDVGSPPTLLNPGKNTRFTYRVFGLKKSDINEINSITENVDREYMKARMSLLFSKASSIEYDGMHDRTYEDNLVMIDSGLPRLYGELILEHYRSIGSGVYDVTELADRLATNNPMGYRRAEMYRYKLKKFLAAAALGMTPGKEWDGQEAATGGYVIIKKDGDVLCYHLYNRNFFEEYLLNNTRIDRPSASRYDFGYVYSFHGNDYIDLNVQVRFKPIR